MRNRLRRSIVVLGLLAAACTTDGAGSGPSGPAREPGQALGFTDVAAEVGLDFQQSAFHWDVTPDVGVMLGGGVCWLDYDGDGWMDLFAVNSYSQAEASRWQDEGGRVARSSTTRKACSRMSARGQEPTSRSEATAAWPPTSTWMDARTCTSPGRRGVSCSGTRGTAGSPMARRMPGLRPSAGGRAPPSGT